MIGILITGCVFTDFVDKVFPEEKEDLVDYKEEEIRDIPDTSRLEVDEVLYATEKDIRKTSAKIKINGEYITEEEKGEVIHVPTIYLGDRLLVPIQSLRDELDLKMEWTAGGMRPEIDIRYKNTVIKLISGTNRFYITEIGDGTKETRELLGQTPNIEFENRFYVPIRFISEIFSIDVKWMDELNEVHLEI